MNFAVPYVAVIDNGIGDVAQRRRVVSPSQEEHFAGGKLHLVGAGNRDQPWFSPQSKYSTPFINIVKVEGRPDLSRILLLQLSGKASTATLAVPGAIDGKSL